MNARGVDPSAASAGSRPTNIRWVIVAMTGLTTAVAMMGRLDLGVLGKSIQDAFSFNTQTMGWIFSAFVFAYHPFQIPGGWAGDRFGPRKVFTSAILLWAAATAAMGVVGHFSLTEWIGVAWSFAILRFLVGVGEAPMSPNAARVVASWMGRKRRGIGVSFHMIGIGVGGALSPLVITWVAQRWGWRPSFYLAGLCGLVVALLWWFYSTDRPEDHPQVNAAEIALIHSGIADHGTGEPSGFGAKERTPWGKFFSSPSVWGILASYFCQGYMPTIYSTWFFIYLERERGLSLIQGGLWGSLPFLTIMVLAPVGGFLSDFWVERLGKRRGRRVTVWFGMGSSALLIWAGVHTANNTVAMLMLGAAAGLNYFALPSWWATCIDLTPEHAGALSGLMNMSSGGWLSPILTAYIVVHFGWTPALDCAALVTAVGGLLWFFIDAGKGLEKSPAKTAAGQSGL